ncbi:MAG: hypothetical protein KTR31_21410 [Myxococcales bacterium]|nr:hypothetical protein [Myxococcales bacterium]
MVTFLRQFLSKPVEIGALAPSGRQLARLMVSASELEPDHVVVELGAGTGPVTQAILDARAEGPLVSLEPNATLAGLLRRRFPEVDVDERPAQQLPEILQERGWGSVDRFVSSLPFAIWPEELQNDVLDAVVATMAPGGRMVTFSYLQSQLLPASARLREQLTRRFSSVRRTRVAWMNLPPALVFVCDA